MRYTVSYGSVQEFILEHNLNENDTIYLHPRDYDAVALEFLEENSLPFFRTIEVLGVKVLEDTAGEVRKNHIQVLPLAAS